jgi:hypothetical protein
MLCVGVKCPLFVQQYGLRVRFVVLTAVNIFITIFWDEATRTFIDIFQPTWHHLQKGRVLID